MLWQLAVVALLALFVKPVEKSVPAEKTAGAAGKAVAQTAAAKPQAQAGMLEGLVGFFTNKQQLLLGISGFMFMFVSVGFATWTNKYAQSLGCTPVQGGMIITCYSIAGIIASCLSGGLAKKIHMSHRNFLMLTLTGMGVMTISSLCRDRTWVTLVGIIYGAVSYLPSTHYTTSAMMLAGERFTATAASTQNLLFQMASLIMPIVGRTCN